jgi:hypothetical protein
MLGELAAILRVSPLLQVAERQTSRDLTALCPTLLSIDPDSHQLTILSSPRQAHELAEAARVIGILSFALPQPA